MATYEEAIFFSLHNLEKKFKSENFKISLCELVNIANVIFFKNVFSVEFSKNKGGNKILSWNSNI